MQLDFAVLDQRFVVLVTLFEGLAGQVVQIGYVGWREQGPLTVLKYTLHEQVRNPVGSVHVVRAATVVTGVFAQFQKLFDIQVPGFQITAHCALALAALVYRNRGVVDYLKEGHDTLRLTVSTFDVGTHGAHWRPVVAQTAGKFRQHGVVVDRVINA